jgi:hypothetical protein
MTTQKHPELVMYLQAAFRVAQADMLGCDAAGTEPSAFTEAAFLALAALDLPTLVEAPPHPVPAATLPPSIPAALTLRVAATTAGSEAMIHERAIQWVVAQHSALSLPYVREQVWVGHMTLQIARRNNIVAYVLLKGTAHATSRVRRVWRLAEHDFRGPSAYTANANSLLYVTAPCEGKLPESIQAGKPTVEAGPALEAQPRRLSWDWAQRRQHSSIKADATEAEVGWDQEKDPFAEAADACTRKQVQVWQSGMKRRSYP